jgi:hypothetical protein
LGTRLTSFQKMPTIQVNDELLDSSHVKKNNAHLSKNNAHFCVPHKCKKVDL